MSDTANDDDISVLIISQRERPDGFGRQPAYTAFLEGEDTLAAAVDAEIADITISPYNHRIEARRLAGRQLRKLSHPERVLPPMPSVRPGRSRPGLSRPRYDIGVFVAFTNWDLPLLERLPEVRERCDRLVAWLPELWPSDLERSEARYEAFGLLDAIMVGMEAGARRLQELTPVPVHYVPPAVDTTRFVPSGAHQPRPIDVLGIGRRNRALHEQLLDWSHKTGKLYVYDSLSGATVPNVAEHRQNLGTTYARTNVALTNYAKSDLPEVTQGEREIPGRLWEALAGGALMIGMAPDAELQERVIGRSVVVEQPEDPAQTRELVADLIATDHQDARIASTQLALRHHDWAHRWRQLFDNAGVATPRGLSSRIENLAAMADSLSGNTH